MLSYSKYSSQVVSVTNQLRKLTVITIRSQGNVYSPNKRLKFWHSPIDCAQNKSSRISSSSVSNDVMHRSSLKPIVWLAACSCWKDTVILQSTSYGLQMKKCLPWNHHHSTFKTTGFMRQSIRIKRHTCNIDPNNLLCTCLTFSTAVIVSVDWSASTVRSGQSCSSVYINVVISNVD